MKPTNSVLASIAIVFIVSVHSVDAQCSTSTTCDSCTDRSNCIWCNDDDWVGSRCLSFSISGCSDEAYFNSDCSSSNSLSGAAVAGIVIGVLVLTVFIITCCCYGCAGCYWYNRRMQRMAVMNAGANANVNAYPSQPYAPGHPMQPAPYGQPQPGPYGQPQPGPYGQPMYAQAQGQGQVGGMPQYGGPPPEYGMAPQGAPQSAPQYQPQAYDAAPMPHQPPPAWQPSGEGSGMDTSKPVAPPAEGDDDFNPKKPGQ